MEDRLHADVTDGIICCFYNVYNLLGYGFLEKVYEKALLVEFERMNLKAEAQVPVEVTYRNCRVGEYFCDLLVAGEVIVEVKAVRSLQPEHEAQLLNYLKATRVEVGLLLNFGPKPEVKRRAFSNQRK
ncbi:GxxExxY protein [Geothermobacter hydrogeniphilus]|uniref:GxxExxY protein n=1 Tax=Geothermobacter hydrogeniphilus TaxID=1969733 RepID=A0A1X0XSH6_9BACT|nr:GxxExxY protein [Geothermobacter hydrogeniphilus]ORJ55873.1 GxxExxY protein [Geothermobacter hydrogeniphilus]